MVQVLSPPNQFWRLGEFFSVFGTNTKRTLVSVMGVGGRARNHLSIHVYLLPPPPLQKKTYATKIPEELFLGPLRQFCVTNYAKEFPENYFLESYVSFT